MRQPCLVLLLAPALAVHLPAAPLSAAEPDAKGVEFFEQKIRPVLVATCYGCHSAQAGKKRGGLSLDTKAGVLKGGDTGPALVPGQPDKSLLLSAIRQDGDLKMPPKGDKLPDAVVNDFRRWIEMGAPDPRDQAVAAAPAIDWQTARQFWSFRPVHAQPLPTVKDASWPKTDPDRFILARLEAEGLRPVTAADRRTLIRRATFDLLGLPPTPEEIDAFLQDESPRAFEKVVDRLLSSPHYGERWARHWLDVARYAEDQAHTFAVKPNTEAFRYRDWVIDALNADMPYDRFVKLQIAADLMQDGSADSSRQQAALGFFGLGAQYYKNSDAARAAADELDDRVDTLARGFLGLTVSCARCHDHKFDPIPTQDYYSLAGIFWSSKLANVPLGSKAEVNHFQQAQQQVQEADKRLKDFTRAEKERLAKTQADKVGAYLLAAWKVRARRQSEPKFGAAAQAKQDGLDAAVLDRWLKLLEPNNKTGQKVAALAPWRNPALPPKGSVPEPGQEIVQAAGDFQQRVQSLLGQPAGKGDKAKDDLTPLLFGETGGFAPADNELTARLSADDKARLATLQAELEVVKKSVPPPLPVAHALVESNPVDLHVYVRGNPAQQGELAPRRFLRVVAGDDPPKFTNGSGRLELAEAIAGKDNPLTPRVIVNRVWGWHFGRGLVGTPSNFGKLGERPTHPELLDHLAARFVANGWSLKWLHREIMLSATYQLASVDDPAGRVKDPDNRLLWRGNRRRLDVESWRDALLAVSGQLDPSFGGPTTDLGSAQNRRRTVYGKVSRHALNGLLRLFDFPDANITSERRTETTVPQQQLFVLNSPFFVAQAKSLAARLNAAEKDDAARVARAYLLVYGRPATEAERELSLHYLAGKDDPAEAGHNQLTRWERYAQALLAGNEFLYID
jgi:cytochrome c553